MSTFPGSRSRRDRRDRRHRRHCDTHRKTRAALAIAAALTLLAAGQTMAADARAVAMGGARTAAARGLAAAAANPACLAFSPGFAIGLASATVDVHNNSFSLARYNDVSGRTLTEVDKQRLLADIPAAGFRLDAGVDAGAIGLQRGRFALTTRAVAAGCGNLDRDVFDLVLFGNHPGQTVDFDDTWGEGYAVGRVSLSYGQPVWTGAAGRVAVGLTASYLHGLYAVRVEQAYGHVTTDATAISGEAFLAALTAEGGDGYGLDLGAAWQAPGGWTVGLVLDNAVAQVNWRGKIERTEYRVTAAELTVLGDGLSEAVVDADTTFAASAFTTALPRTVRLGVARDNGRWSAAADLVQGFADGPGTSTTPRLNLGAQWRPLGWLLPRAGLSLGGAVGGGAAGGLGWRLGCWQIDVAVAYRGGLRGTDARGIGGGITTALVF